MGVVDISIRQGDTLPALTATLVQADGLVLNLTGATVRFVMRQLTSTKPVINAEATITTPELGSVSYFWTATDTATAGMYSGEFHVTLGSGATYTWPNRGYLEISIEANLTAAGPTELVSVADAKRVLRIPATNRNTDADILRFLRAARPAVEALTGPIIPQTYNEWYEGGQTFIRLRHRPNVGYGTTALLTVQAISEYSGPIEWPLSIVASPDEGQLYSAMVTRDLGQVVRRTAGGGVQGFPPGPQAVHVVYTAGQNAVPDNVYQGTLELIRVSFQQTQQGRPRANAQGYVADDSEPTDAPPPVLIPNRVRQMLSPTRRHPGLA